jgi:predicted metal-dependent hydrolase
MTDLLYFLAGIIILAVVFKFGESKTYNMTTERASINGKTYEVRELPDKADAANLLARINHKFDQITDFIHREKPFDLFRVYVIRQPELTTEKLNDKHNTALADHFTRFKTDIKRLLDNYRPDSLSENTPNSEHTAYSENKGERVVFCLRSKTDESLMDLNTMTFVALHELSHLMTRTIGHDQEFWDNFRIILRIAIKNGIYQCVDYNMNMTVYCGQPINDTPLKCSDVV